MSVTALSLFIAVVLAATASGGTYAYLNSSATVSGAAVTAGTAQLVLTPLVLATTALYPGQTRFGTATVTNSGDVALALRVVGLTGPAASNEFSKSLVVGVSIIPTVAACAASLTPTWTGTFATAAAATLGTTLVKGGAGVLCVSVTLPADAPNGSQSQSALNFTLSIDGTQA